MKMNMISVLPRARIGTTGSWLVLTAALLSALSGCSSPVKLDNPAPVESRDLSARSAAGAASGANASTSQSSVTPVDLGSKTDAAAGAGRTVYFDFDSFVIKDEYRPVVETHAKVLVANKQKHMMIEGHTDERGGREYNLALGQKRAEAVQKAMLLLGASENQLEAVSYGEERPAVQGNDEAAWSKNRRAELKDR